MKYGIEIVYESEFDDYAVQFTIIATYDDKQKAQEIVDHLNAHNTADSHIRDYSVVELPHNPTLEQMLECIKDY